MVNSFVKKLFCFNCPQCNTPIFLFSISFRQCRYGLTHCKNCGSDLKASNAILLASLYGLFCGALIATSQYWKFGTEWLRILVLIAVCWFVVWPLFSRLLARWEIAADAPALIYPSPKARKWSRYASLSSWLTVVAIFSPSLIWWFCTGQMQRATFLAAEANGSAKTQLLDRVFGWSQIAMSATFICIALAVVFCVISIICYMKAKKARRVSTT